MRQLLDVQETRGWVVGWLLTVVGKVALQGLHQNIALLHLP